MKFSGDQTYAIKTEWRFIPTSDAQGEFSSRDSKLQLNAGTTLDKSQYVIVMGISRLPSDAPGQLLSDPYAIYASNGLPKSGQLDLTMRLASESTSASIYGWNGTEWVKFDSTIDGKTATANVDPMEIYIAAE